MSRIWLLIGGLAALASAQVGRLDTIGGTTYDWQMGGPASRFIVNSPGHGIPVIWERSLAEHTTFPDRNTGYNWYDYATRTWVANDTDFMRSGGDVFAVRCWGGSVDVDPNTGIAHVSGHWGNPLHVGVAREMGHGSLVFEYSEGPEPYLWPASVMDSAGRLHVAMIDDGTRNMIYHTRMTSWSDWDTPQAMAAPCPDPEFLSHHIGRSRVSQRVALTWVYTQGAPDPGFFRETTDGGETWLEPESLPWPPAFGPDTSPSFHISGLYPHYDRQDRFHIVCAVMPFIGGTGYAAPVEIWHWCRENEPQWSRIARAECDSFRAPVGYNTLFACRPSIGEDRAGGLHVCWEQFDSLNIEPGPPEYLRADIWYCRDNDDNGASWQDPARITVPDEASKRFPCIYDYTDEDTVRVVYLVDEVAGFFVQGEGYPTRNPIICQHIPIDVGGVEEQTRLKVEGGRLSRTVYRAPELARMDCRVLDIQGRDVTDERGRLAPGIYFLKDEGGRLKDEPGSRPAVRKVVVQ